MKELSSNLNKKHRIIEFSNKTSFFSNQIIKTQNYLLVSKNGTFDEGMGISLSRKNFLSVVQKNSCDVIVMNCAGWKELKSLQNTSEAKLFYERVTLINIMPIIYFLIKGLISRRTNFNGLFYLKRGIMFSAYVGLKKQRNLVKRTRQYLSPQIGIEGFFQELNEKNISYCILRWFDNLPDIDENEDVDILVEDNDLNKLYSVLNRKPGTIPFDIYSKTGLPGSDFKNLPYYTFDLAQMVLDNSVLYKNVYKVPTQENYFYLLAYHAVFHKGENSGIPCNRYDVKCNIKPDHDYLHHLKTILSHTDLEVGDFTLEGLHEFLDSKGYVPPLDTQYKLSLYNNYLNAYLEEYHDQSELLEKFEGLTCFVVREKIVESGLLEDLKKYIQKLGFSIICTSKLEGIIKREFSKGVRGGNWNQGPWPSNAGLPSVLVVAVDVYPIEPQDSDQKKHPGITNKRIQDKNEIRTLLNKKFTDKNDWCNGVHSSDNEIQAVEYLTLGGLDKNEILEEIKKYKDEFRSRYPVIKVLSRFSRRAKVELISYRGTSAVLKTFKPKCELFLSYEIEAYTEFRDIKAVPQLLESGDNYFITEYIDGARPFRGKINIKTLKRCLELLRKIYDRGYSLLDFNPSNFLVDKKGDLHLIDFEFLHKYKDKPAFLDCYDLTGIPDTLDQLHRPISKSQNGRNPFEVNWGGYTGISYEELSKLDDTTVYLKSLYRFYKLKIAKLTRLFRNRGGQGIKVIYKNLP